MTATLKKIHSKKLVLLAGSIIFVFGALIYPLRETELVTSGVLIGNFSAFAHALFFMLLLAYPFQSRPVIIISALLIASITVSFEAIQHPFILHKVADGLPSQIVGYGLNGTFDILDIVASLMGVLTSLAIIMNVSEEMRGKP